MPQLDKVSVSSTVFWTLIAYFLFYCLLRFFILPQVLKNIKFRNLKLVQLSQTNDNYFLDFLNKTNIYLIHKFSHIISLYIQIINLFFNFIKMLFLVNFYIEDFIFDLFFESSELVVFFFRHLLDVFGVVLNDSILNFYTFLVKIRGAFFSLVDLHFSSRFISLYSLFYFSKSKLSLIRI